MSSEIQTLEKAIKETGLSFIFNPDEELDPDKQVASIFFIAEHNGKKVIYDAFVTSLFFDFHMQVMDKAEDMLFTKYPKQKGKDYVELDEKFQDEIDDIMDEIYEKELVKVTEKVEVYPADDDDEYFEMEASINAEKMTEEVLEKFVKSFSNNTLKLDTTPRSFTEIPEEGE